MVGQPPNRVLVIGEGSPLERCRIWEYLQTIIAEAARVIEATRRTA
jgi:hypothetical protein